jgi:hypothetical protein
LDRTWGCSCERDSDGVVAAEPVIAIAVFLHILCQPPARVVGSLELETGRRRLPVPSLAASQPFWCLFCWSLAADIDWYSVAGRVASERDRCGLVSFGSKIGRTFSTCFSCVHTTNKRGLPNRWRQLIYLYPCTVC